MVSERRVVYEMMLQEVFHQAGNESKGTSVSGAHLYVYVKSDHDI